MTERALSLARDSGDLAGVGRMLRARGMLLVRLGQNKQAARTFDEAAEAWGRLGYTPGQIDALGRAGIILNKIGLDGHQERFRRALGLGRNDAQRPLESAIAVYKIGGYTYAFQIWDVAREFYTLVLDIWQEHEPGTQNVANALYELGTCDFAQSNYDSALTYYHKALAVELAIDPLAAQGTLQTIANIHHRLGRNSEAESFQRRAIEMIGEHAPATPRLASAYSGLAAFLSRQGDLDRAEQILREALEPLDEDCECPGVRASILVTLADVLVGKWDFAKARSYYEVALAMYEADPHAYKGRRETVGKLREVAFRQGDLASAMQFAQRSVKLFERFRPDSYGMAAELDGVGDIAATLGDLEAAEEYYQRALGIREKRKVSDSPPTAATLRDLGDLARRRGQFTAAGSYLARSLDILESSGESPLDLALTIRSLALLAVDVGDLDTAERHVRRARSIWEAHVGADHPDVAEASGQLAITLARTGRAREAFDEALRAERLGRAHVQHLLLLLPERQALRYNAVRSSGVDVAVTLAIERAGGIPDAVPRAWDAVIRSRALVLAEMAERRQAVADAADEETLKHVERLARARKRVSRLVILRDDGDVSDLGDRVREATIEKEAAEQVLAEHSLRFRRTLERSRAGLPEVTASLEQGDALVAFARFDRHLVGPFDDERPVTELDPWYVAFVLPGPEARPLAVALGSARDIDGEVAEIRSRIRQVSTAPGRSSGPMEATYRKTGGALRARVWDPIEPLLGAARRVFVVPDGALHFLNFAALPNDGPGYLVESAPLIQYLSAERDLVAGSASRGGSGHGLLALGSPAFRASELFAALAPSSPADSGDASPVKPATFFRGQRSTCGSFESLDFQPIPASGAEVQEIAGLWRRSAGNDEVIVLTGTQASETALKTLARGRRVLHLATHGFFVSDECPSVAKAGLGGTLRMSPAEITGENPLLLSGLALAGANLRSFAGEREDDGILTAEEISALDLDGVELTVLSACDTGLGTIEASEGVLGMRRAFQVAGAGAVVMSLWQVEDEMVRRWMSSFYRRRFDEDRTTAAAARMADLELLRERRRRGESTHPFYWAGFVVAAGVR